MRSPILLSAEAAIPANGLIELDTTALRNPFNTGMLLDEIRMELYFPSPSFEAQGLLAFRPRFRWKQEFLTNGYIPFPVLGRLLNPGAIIGSGLPGELPFERAYTWRLPRPLYVPAGEAVVPQILNVSSFADYIFRVTYAGRSLGIKDPVPPTVCLPWATTYVSPVFDSDEDTIAESNESDLTNPFSQPLHIQRFVGRVEHDTVYRENSTTSVPIFVRMTDSLGRHAVRDPTPFDLLFSFPTRTWEARSMLAPKGFYIATLNAQLASAAPGSVYRTYITMVGHRELKTEVT